jgi:hypothetical protein
MMARQVLHSAPKAAAMSVTESPQKNIAAFALDDLQCPFQIRPPINQEHSQCRKLDSFC